jgi:2-polyprenyl-3-methyl-5-hydroxy-6-metoxy-1,4-benzoquinol methylase
LSTELLHGRSTKEFQDFFTPPAIAEELAGHLLKQLKGGETILDPAVGSGALIWPLLASDKKLTVLCMDIQQDYIQYVGDIAKKKGYLVIKQPFGLSISN